MKKSKFSEEQTALTLKEVEAGAMVGETYRNHRATGTLRVSHHHLSRPDESGKREPCVLQAGQAPHRAATSNEPQILIRVIRDDVSNSGPNQPAKLIGVSKVDGPNRAAHVPA